MACVTSYRPHCAMMAHRQGHVLCLALLAIAVSGLGASQPLGALVAAGDAPAATAPPSLSHSSSTQGSRPGPQTVLMSITEASQASAAGLHRWVRRVAASHPPRRATQLGGNCGRRSYVCFGSSAAAGVVSAHRQRSMHEYRPGQHDCSPCSRIAAHGLQPGPDAVNGCCRFCCCRRRDRRVSALLQLLQRYWQQGLGSTNAAATDGGKRPVSARRLLAQRQVQLAMHAAAHHSTPGGGMLGAVVAMPLLAFGECVARDGTPIWAVGPGH